MNSECAASVLTLKSCQEAAQDVPAATVPKPIFRWESPVACHPSKEKPSVPLARCPECKLCSTHLQTSFSGTRPLGKNPDDEAPPVHDRQAQVSPQISLLDAIQSGVHDEPAAEPLHRWPAAASDNR